MARVGGVARPRQFDEDQAVDAAVRMFWQRGYEDTSTSDLCEATGLGRGSIYNTFNSKQELFDKALDRYTADRAAELAELSGREGAVREKVRALFDSVLQDEFLGDGCLVTNTLIELAPKDPAIAAKLRTDYDRRVLVVRNMLEAAQRGGEIAPEASAEELAHLVLGTVTSIRVMARGGHDRSTLEALATATLRAL